MGYRSSAAPLYCSIAAVPRGHIAALVCEYAQADHLERDEGLIVGIEVKASATARSGDFDGLRILALACQHRFAYGVVLYDGTDVAPFGDRLAAAPLSSLWG